MQFSQMLKDKLSFEQKQKLRSVISSIKSLGKSPSYFNQKIISMHFYHNMVFIYKGNNIKASNRGSDHKVHN
jgi:hypothetical protein